MIVANQQSTRLPDGWEWIPIGETGEYINGFAFKPSHRDVSGLPIVRIQNLTDESKPFNTTNVDVPADYKINTGDMLMSWSATLDVFLWRRGPALVNQHIFKVVPDERVISKRLLFYWLKQGILQLQKTDHLHGSTMMHINRGPFMAHLLPLPPSAEQTRIVAKLEELLSDLDVATAELKTAQVKLEQFRQSVLMAAVEGSLTAQWRTKKKPRQSGAQLLDLILRERRVRWESLELAKFSAQGKTPPSDWQKKYPEPVEPDTSGLPTLPKGWVWATIDQLTVEQRYGSSAKTNEDSSGIPVLRMGNIQGGQLNYTNLKYLPTHHNDFPSLYLQDGDLLFNRTNSLELVGKTAVYRSEVFPCSFASYLIAVRFGKDFSPEFASAFINSTYGRHWVKSVAIQQTGQANVNGSKLAALAVPVPPKEEQIAIIGLLSEQMEIASHQEECIAKALKQSLAQRHNILQAAFTGQLVPQDPSDEPAGTLLERVRQERARQPKAPKKKQPKEKAIVVKKLSDVLAEAGEWIPAQDAFRQCGVTDGALTDRIEELYSELRELDKAGKLDVEAVMDSEGRKLYDKLKLREV